MTGVPLAGLRAQPQLRPCPDFPVPVGAHELAWSFILDHVFARAAQAGLRELEVCLPSAALVDDCKLRAALTAAPHTPASGAGRGMALLDFGPYHAGGLAGINWVATLRGGVTAPRALRALPHLPFPGFTLREQRSVLTAEVQLWGAGIRLAYLLDRPDLADRASFGMRRAFARPGHVPSYYLLQLWSRA